MKKHLNRGRNYTILAALFFGFSVSVSAAPHNMASWGGDKKEGHASHGASGHGGGDWKKSKGSNSLGMGGEGFMTARLRAVWSFDLTKKQKANIRAIQRDLRSKHWALEDKIEVTSDKLFDLYNGMGERDAKAIGKVYGEIFEFRRQIIVNAIEAGNKVEAELTKKQLEGLRKWRPKHKWGGGWSGK